MVIEFTPSTLTLMEFVGTTSQQVSLQDPDLEIEITNVSYQYSKPIPDLSISWEGVAFTFSATFSTLFDRPTKYLIQLQPTAEAKQYIQATTISELPTTFKGIYQVSPPPESVSITFEITVNQRTLVPLGEWEESTYQWTLVVESDFAFTAQAIKNAVKQGAGYQQALQKYPEVEL